ncbi:MAG: ParA family protein, partial [Phascolarctobacterium sp.]
LTVTDVLTQKADIKSAILKTKAGYAILPAGRNLFEHQSDIKADTLAKALTPLKSYFDYILIDCPPALSSLSINGLVAADKVIIPVICGNFCDIASVDTLNTIDTLKQNGTTVTAVGILVILYNNRSNLDKFMLGKYNEIASKYSTKVFDAKIRQCQKIKEAQVLGQSILQYAPKSNAVIDYNAFVDELIG